MQELVRHPHDVDVPRVDFALVGQLDGNLDRFDVLVVFVGFVVLVGFELRLGFRVLWRRALGFRCSFRLLVAVVARAEGSAASEPSGGSLSS